VPARKALQLVLEDAAPVGSETVSLVNASGRVLAADLVANRTQPPFPASAMDGYAIRAKDVAEAGVTLKKVGEVAAGHPFRGSVSSGECVRIFTGAPVPDGTDTIIIQENATENESVVTVHRPAPEGKFVRRAGLDFRQGDTMLRKGAILDPQALSLAASMDHPVVEVFTRPKVAIMATGDELVLPGEATGEGQIIASNTFGVAAIAETAGADALNLGIAADTIEDLMARIQSALDDGADLIVTSGGASVGDHDLVKPVMEKLGFVFSFIKIAMRPGKPVIFGRAIIGGKERRFLGLAGNPVSSLVSSHIYLKPLIRLLGGFPADIIKPVSAVLEVDLPANDEREDYMRGTARRGSDGKLFVRPFERQDSSMLATLARADCLIIRPVDAPVARKGDAAQAILLRDV
jgi:molybdopterin molybdotransferase